jgi:Right handed beta helix region
MRRLNRLAVLLMVLLAISSAAGPSVAAEGPGPVSRPCPTQSINVNPGQSIQAAVERYGNGAVFCLKNGIHRAQIVRPRNGQTFFGEGMTILNGSRVLADFNQVGRYWVARQQKQIGRRSGECGPTHPACNLPEQLFIDDRPLIRVLHKDDVEAGRFFFDYIEETIYFADDPKGHKIEVTAAPFAFESRATGVSIKNLTIEKYASAAQKGAVQAREGQDWIVEGCAVRLNSGGGISAGSKSRISDCDIHDNGQLGIGAAGHDIIIENNRIWANNTRGFSPQWEAGGVKVTRAENVILRQNRVFENSGPGLWCDIDCRDVLYELNIVERNRDAGIFHEISYTATIRNNVLAHNGLADVEWFWGNDILVAASQDVNVYGNKVVTEAGRCAILLVDQGRPRRGGGKYKTKNNVVRNNDITFEGAPCAGGASDVDESNENFLIISNGNNVFDGNQYRVPRASGPARFVWGHEVFSWEGFQKKHLEQNGRLTLY